MKIMGIFIAVIAFLSVFGLCSFVIYKCTKGTVRIVSELLWSMLAVFSIIIGLDDHALHATDILSVIVFVLTCVVVAFLIYCIVKKIRSKTTVTQDHPLARIKGTHICGLTVPKGTKISVCMYHDEVIFTYKDIKISSFDRTAIISASSHAKEEAAGFITTVKEKRSVASTLALLNGDLAAAYLFRPRTVTYDTEKKMAISWYFVLDTVEGEIVIGVTLTRKLLHFVEKCNKLTA